MDAEHLDENPLVDFPLIFQPSPDFSHQLDTFQRAHVDHEIASLITWNLKHLDDIIQIEEIAVK